jgi:hypothetical protein
MNTIVIKPPARAVNVKGYKSIFLAGSIDLGKAENWQSKITDEIKDFPIIIYNPRRDEWDDKWEQSIDNPKFKQQVDWELKHLESVDKIIMVLTKNSVAPISLLEFGLYARSGKLVIYCPEGFWRKGNIDVVCSRYNIPQVEKFEELITLIKYS